MINKGLIAFSILAMALGLYFADRVINNDDSGEGKTVTILQIVEHPALDVTRTGIEDYLFDCCKIKTLYESAHGDPGLAAQIAQKFLQRSPSAVVTIGTVATQAAMGKIDQIPIVFSSVTDPIESGLVSNLESPTANVTGVSNFVAAEKQLKVFLQFLPNIKKIGFIYNPGESNSITSLKDTRRAAKNLNIEIVEGVANNSNEVSTALLNIINQIDAVFIHNDNTALSAIQSIVKVGEDNNIPVLCSDIDTINNGVFLATGADQFEIGQDTGRLVEKIIIKHEDINDIPVVFPKKIMTRVNIKMAAKLGISIDDNLLKQENVEVMG